LFSGRLLKSAAQFPSLSSILEISLCTIISTFRVQFHSSRP
jgi:hypothetical protein